MIGLLALGMGGHLGRKRDGWRCQIRPEKYTTGLCASGTLFNNCLTGNPADYSRPPRMQIAMDYSSLRPGEFSVILCERATGIVQNVDTLERWTDRIGGRAYFTAESLQQAHEIAEKFLSARDDLEASIHDHSGNFVTRLNSPGD